MADNTENKKRKSRMDAKETVALLNKIAQTINNQSNANDFVFAMKKVEMTDDFKDIALKKYKEIIERYGITVQIIENLDIKDVTDEDRYYIRISDVDRNFVDIELIKYREDSLDFEFDQVEFFSNQLVRLLGVLNTELEECAEEIAEYISSIINIKEMYTLQYNSVGWDVLHNQPVFKYDTLLSKNKYTYGFFDDDLRISLDAKGSEEYWMNMAKMLFINEEHVKDALILCAAVSGVVRQLLTYTKENNINMNIVGNRASGKSTIQHFILSFFGNPAEIEGSFIDTINSAEINRIKLSVIPYMLDERLLRYQASTEKKKKNEIMMDIFREYEGKGKERLSGKYANMSGQRTCGAVISSSVERMMDYIYDNEDFGQFRRFIEIEVSSEETFDDAKSAEKYENLSKACYGFGVKKLVNYILENNLYDENTIEERYEKAKQKVQNILETFDWHNIYFEYIDDMKSSISRFSLIYLTGELINEAFGWEMNLEAIVEILKENLIEKLKIVETKQKRVSLNDGNNAFANFIRFIYDNKSYFTKDKKELEQSKDKFIAYYEETENVITIRFRKDIESKCLSFACVSPEEQLNGSVKVDEQVISNMNRIINLYGKYIGLYKGRDRLTPAINGKQVSIETETIYLYIDKINKDFGNKKEEGDM